jgi:hypothetical protein
VIPLVGELVWDVINTALVDGSGAARMLSDLADVSIA